MMLHQWHYQPQMRPITQVSSEAVPSVVEYAFYGLILIGIMPFGIALSGPLIGSGLYAALAGLCVLRLGSRAIIPIAIPLICATSFVVLQILVHNESLKADNVKPFVIWMLMLIIVQSLCMREGFLHRFAWTSLVIGLLVLPYIEYSPDEFARAGLGKSFGLSNPNGIGYWFGFLCVYFVIAGIEAKRTTRRIAYWLIGAGCFYVVGLSVSRAALLAVVISTTVSLRGILKRGFLPALSLLLLAWILYTTGIFEQMTASYAARAGVETGRFLVWPLAIERFFSSPLIGVGASHVTTYVPIFGPLTPHNSFLFIALASGIIPLTFFVAYWWRAARRALRLSAGPSDYAPFLVPLWIFTFLSAQSNGLDFMNFCTIVTLAMPIGINASGRVYRNVWGRTVRHLGHWREGRDSPSRHQRFVRPAKL